MNNNKYKPNLYSAWVEETLASLSVAQKIGQLLHPYVMPANGYENCLDHFDGIEVGGAFFFPESQQTLAKLSDRIQSNSKVPVIIASDLENGAGRMVNGAVVFPDNMAIAATNNREYGYVLGEAAAKEGREVGVHWSFGPVVDINANPHNPITNTRSFGDDQQRIADMANAMIQGMQNHGFAACAKHFPGDGYDDRDQHLCTTINPLSFEQWQLSSGALFQQVIDQGVWTIMIGHIALPAVDPGPTGYLKDAPPAVMSRKLTTELLRERMGFEGVIISDAIGMGGSCSHYPETEVVVRALEAGCDQILFCQPRASFNAIEQALVSGRLTEAQIDLSVRRILALKETMNLHQDRERKPCPAADRQRFKSLAGDMANAALTEVVNELPEGTLPLRSGMKVLSVHIRGDALYQVDGIDERLRERGLNVVRWDESSDFRFGQFRDLSGYDAILIHTVFGPTWATNRIRLSGNFNRGLAEIMKSHHPCLLMTSFGNPYQLYEFPKTRCYLNAYSPDDSSQLAYVKFLFGELKPSGVSPVNLDKLLNTF